MPHIGYHKMTLYRHSTRYFNRSLKCLFTAANLTSRVPEASRVESPASSRHFVLPASAFSPTTGYQVPATAALPPSNIRNSPSGRYIDIIMFIESLPLTLRAAFSSLSSLLSDSVQDFACFRDKFDTKATFFLAYFANLDIRLSLCIKKAAPLA